MDHFAGGKYNRIDILKRLLRTIVCMIAFSVVKFLLQAVVLFQYAYLLVAGKSSEPLRRFGLRLSLYTFELLKYVTLNDNKKPFPFSDLPESQNRNDPPNHIDFS
ncbi:DUF4389 domain-containing protein [Maridesulfovibrio frigidus]|uniref:DUF4389 domain-containing protein n=1 Tax=Maridesulfovibrio frigidus TaxID=340956 RepID=UPI0004E280C0|nr:DUF4389 domain-containing protein [Maridesulfovibrio frigidus]